ncbi:MAG: hypothetical protein U1F19_03685 [Lysobacterales bacterium]
MSAELAAPALRVRELRKTYDNGVQALARRQLWMWHLAIFLPCWAPMARASPP